MVDGVDQGIGRIMDELKKVIRVNKPDLKLIVLDSVTGNDIFDQSQLFNEAVG
ncbi:MAG: hypothetical protein HC767_11575, partial [Akkermansiaceae bacterium]|nr:hypothetical protein [Akkermansiaceae bacterium]